MSGLRSSVVPDLIAALVAQLTTVLPGVSVTTGLDSGIRSGPALAVGVIDPEAKTPTTGATSTIEWSTSMSTDGFNESGDLSLAAIVTSGSTDLEDAISQAYGILSDVIGYLRSSWSNHDLLGVEGLWDLHVTSTELTPALSDSGCVAYLLFHLAFQATI